MSAIEETGESTEQHAASLNVPHIQSLSNLPICISTSTSNPAFNRRSSVSSTNSTDTTNSFLIPSIGFTPGIKAWICALMFTTVSAMIAPLFLFRAYSMPISPLFIPVLVYPLCNKCSAWFSSCNNNDKLAATHSPQIWNRIVETCHGFNIGSFSKEEMVWMTSMVAAGGSFAPAYQWIATIDTDYGQPLNNWQKFAVVISTQLFGWCLGQMLSRVFVGHSHGMIWPDNLPLSYLIQTLFPDPHSSGQEPDQRHTDNINMSDSSATISNIFVEASHDSIAGKTEKIEISEDTCPSKAREGGDSVAMADMALTTSVARKRNLVLFTSATFIYQFLLSYIAPVFKSLCLLCIWAPKSRLMSLFGSGWNGAGILSLTFDWTAMGTLQPLVSPLWAQIHYYVGAALMMYILTPVGWHMNWWGAQELPIVSTSVFDVGGNVYNISLIHHGSMGQQKAADIDILESHLSPDLSLLFNPYSPVRLTVNSALGYIFAVAAITAAAMHLAIWHPLWLRQAARDMLRSLLRLWDPRLLFRTRKSIMASSRQKRWSSSSVDTRSDGENRESVEPGSASSISISQSDESGTWDFLYLCGRVGRVFIFTVSLGAALLSAQMGISTLPGWQILVAVVWSVISSLPIGFVESVTGFTLPMDLLPHILAGWMQAPGRPIETSYFHLWATVPIQVALGWSGVRSYQLAHHCSISSVPLEHDIDKPEEQSRPRRLQLPWMKRGLLVGVILGACINQISYTMFLRSQGEARSLPVEAPPPPLAKQPSSLANIVIPLSFEPTNTTDVPTAKILGWHEEGEFGRLPAALSSELVVWGIVGPRSLFSGQSPYRLIFVYGSLIGLLLPPLLYVLHRLLLHLESCMRKSLNHMRHPLAHRMVCQGAEVAKKIQIPLILTGMVAVPTIPANFIISGLLVAVVGQFLCRYRGKTLVDRSLYSAAMDTGTRLSVALMFVVGQILLSRGMPLSFVSWWGNQIGNVEHCLVL